MERERVADVGRDVVEVGAVALGDDHLGEAGGVRGEHLLLQAADREDAALERDLAGHPDRVLHGPPGEERRQRGRHRDPGARAVLRNRARRDVHVELAVQPLVGDLESVGVRAYPRERDLRRLLHHVAELARQHEALVAVHSRRLDEEDVAAGAGDGEAGRDAGDGGALGGLLPEALAAERVTDELLGDDERRLDLGGSDPRRGLAQQLPELALELSDTRLACVLAHDLLQERVFAGDLVLEEAVPLALARPEVANGDRDLLVDRVAVEADHLHTVEQRARDRLGHVRGGDEDDLRQVELDVEVVVAERVVLRRVEHLEQRSRGVAAPVGADLVDLVEHDHRVHRSGIAQGAHEPTRQRADVGAPVAADLGLVADPAERHAHELAVERAGDRLADRGLAGAGRADQREDRARLAVVLDAALLAELADGEVLDDALLHVVEARVVGVEDLAREPGSRRSSEVLPHGTAKIHSR